MAFGVPAKPPYKRWKKTLSQIANWGRFDTKNFMSIEDIDAWVRSTRYKVMYRGEAKVDLRLFLRVVRQHNRGDVDHAAVDHVNFLRGGP